MFVVFCVYWSSYLRIHMIHKHMSYRSLVNMVLCQQINHMVEDIDDKYTVKRCHNLYAVLAITKCLKAYLDQMAPR